VVRVEKLSPACGKGVFVGVGEFVALQEPNMPRARQLLLTFDIVATASDPFSFSAYPQILEVAWVGELIVGNESL